MIKERPECDGRCFHPSPVLNSLRVSNTVCPSRHTTRGWEASGVQGGTNERVVKSYSNNVEATTEVAEERMCRKFSEAVEAVSERMTRL
jgi:hypothetical protein